MIHHIHRIARAVNIAATFEVHRPQGVYTQELRCGGVVRAVVEVVELVAWVTGCGLVVQLAFQPAGTALGRGGALAVVKDPDVVLP